MDIGKEKVYIQDANMKQARNIYRKSFEMAEREYVFSYSEFTEEEQRGFQAMFMNPHKRGAVYYKPFYNSCYKAGLIDTQKLAEAHTSAIKPITIKLTTSRGIHFKTFFNKMSFSTYSKTFFTTVFFFTYAKSSFHKFSIFGLNPL